MGGLAVLFFIGLYIAIAYWVFKRFEGSSFRWLVLAVAVLIPSGDAVVGRLYLKHLCNEEGGLRVYRVVENVDGFKDDGSSGDYWVRELGYQFVENQPINGLTTRYFQHDGQITSEKSELLKSGYKLSSLYLRGDIYGRHQHLVKTLYGGEILASDTQVSFNGGWAERFIALFSDAGGGAVAWCTNTDFDSMVRQRRLLTSTLKHQ